MRERQGERERERQRDWFILRIGLTIVETGRSKIYRADSEAGDPGKS